MSLLEWGATIFSLIYLIFAIKNKAICFLFGIIGSAIWAYVSFYYYGLLYDAFIQIFYVIISGYGIYKWTRGGPAETEAPISHLPSSTHLIIIILGLLFSFLLYQIANAYEGINYAGLDSFTTVFLIIGTLLLVERKLYSWIYLVVADLVYIYIYGQSGAWLFVGMMVIYSIFGMMGFMNWKGIYQKH